MLGTNSTQILLIMRHHILLLFTVLLSACSSQVVNIEDDQTLNQPKDPEAFRMAGRVFVWKTTHESSPNKDKSLYYVHEYQYNSYTVRTYRTPNADYTPNQEYFDTHLYADLTELYRIEYPTLYLIGATKNVITMQDTLSYTVYDHTYNFICFHGGGATIR